MNFTNAARIPRFLCFWAGPRQCCLACQSQQILSAFDFNNSSSLCFCSVPPAIDPSGRISDHPLLASLPLPLLALRGMLTHPSFRVRDPKLQVRDNAEHVCVQLAFRSVPFLGRT